MIFFLHSVTCNQWYTEHLNVFLTRVYYHTDKDGLNAFTLKPDGNIELTCLNPGNRIVHGFGVVAAQKPLDNA